MATTKVFACEFELLPTNKLTSSCGCGETLSRLVRVIGRQLADKGYFDGFKIWSPVGFETLICPIRADLFFVVSNCNMKTVHQPEAAKMRLTDRTGLYFGLSARACLSVSLFVHCFHFFLLTFWALDFALEFLFMLWNNNKNSQVAFTPVQAQKICFITSTDVSIYRSFSFLFHTRYVEQQPDNVQYISHDLGGNAIQVEGVDSVAFHAAPVVISCTSPHIYRTSYIYYAVYEFTQPPSCLEPNVLVNQFA